MQWIVGKIFRTNVSLSLTLNKIKNSGCDCVRSYLQNAISINFGGLFFEMGSLIAATKEFFDVLVASPFSYLVRTLVAALAISQSILPTGWPENYPLQDGERFDFIVVGSGSAGAIVAKRLAELEQIKVLLLELGGIPPANSEISLLFPTLGGTEHDMNYLAELGEGIGNIRTSNQINYQRGKVLGGCSSVNYLVYSRGVPPNYDDWGEVAPGWDWENVLPYHKKYEGMMDPSVFTPANSYLHSKEGPVLISRPDDIFIAEEANEMMLRAFREIGIPTVLENNGLEFEGASRTHYTSYNGVRSSTAQAYIRYKSKSNLFISIFCRVTKLLFRVNTTDVEGVEVLMKNGNIVNIYANKEVVLSAGAFDTPKLLMLSGIGPKKVLEKVGIQAKVELPVGENLQDHVFVPMVFAGKAGLSSALNNLLVPTKISQFPVPFVSSNFKIDNGTLSGYFDGSPDFQTFNLYFGAGTPDIVGYGCESLGYGSRACSSWKTANVNREVMVVLLIWYRPQSYGNVTLKTDNPLDDPDIKLGFLQKRRDVIGLREGMKKLIEFVDTSHFIRNGGFFVKMDIHECNVIPYGSDLYWECLLKNTASTMLHAAGTCRMREQPEGVVNERLKVHGVKGVRVIDASVMPWITCGNTNAPTMMIGEKGADIIKQDNGYI